MDAKTLIGRINAYILNPLLLLLFAVAFLVFYWGIFQFIRGAGGKDPASSREQGKRAIMWGVIGMLIMFSAFGIIHLVLGTFGVSTAGNFILNQK